MKTIVRKIDVYEFDELHKTIQIKVINNEINLVLQEPLESLLDDVRAAIEKAEKLNTPWFAGQIIYEDCNELILSYCRNYEYTITGEIYVSELGDEDK